MCVLTNLPLPIHLQNFGAILRSLLFLGADACLWSQKNSAPLSPAVSRASAGAMEVLGAKEKLFVTQNLVQFLQESHAYGWQVVGTGFGPMTTSSEKFDMDTPTILVMVS